MHFSLFCLSSNTRRALLFVAVRARVAECVRDMASSSGSQDSHGLDVASVLSVSPSKCLPPRPGSSHASGSGSGGLTGYASTVNKSYRNKTIYDLADETVSYVLRYLRAQDLVIVSEVDRTVFHQYYIRRAVKWQVKHIYNPFYSGLNIGVGGAASLTADLPALASPFAGDSRGSMGSINSSSGNYNVNNTIESSSLGARPGIAYIRQQQQQDKDCSGSSSRNRGGSFSSGSGTAHSSRRSSRANSFTKQQKQQRHRAGSSPDSGSDRASFGSYFNSGNLFPDETDSASAVTAATACMNATTGSDSPAKPEGRLSGLTAAIGEAATAVVAEAATSATQTLPQRRNSHSKTYPVFVSGGMHLDALFVRACYWARFLSSLPA